MRELSEQDLNALFKSHQMICVVPFGNNLSQNPASHLDRLYFSAAGEDGGWAYWSRETQDILKEWSNRQDRQFLFLRAQDVLRIFWKCGISVERPICLSTCQHLLGEELEETRTLFNAERAKHVASRALSSLVQYTPWLKDKGLHRVARLENAVLSAFAAMEAEGIHIEKEKWQSVVSRFTEQMNVAQEKLLKTLGDVVNRNLFGEPEINLDADGELKLALERLLDCTLPDVSKRTLSELDHPVSKQLLEFREARKIVTTYGEEFLNFVDDETSRIYSTFIPLGASTGRVASREPNLQNLPAGEDFHACICAPLGKQLVTADYATCELRILADMAEDTNLIAAFTDGEDVHSVVAARMFQEEVSKEKNSHLRSRAKAIQFGIIYGMGVASLARSLDISDSEAQSTLDRYFKTYPAVRSFLSAMVDRALSSGYAETRLGRKLYFAADVLEGPSARQEISRIAKNMPIQGTSADMLKIAMAGIHNSLRKIDGAFLVNTIHDELVVECEEASAQRVAHIVRDEMEKAHRFLLKRVPPLVDLSVASIWSH
jgi:DNA polymerase I